MDMTSISRCRTIVAIYTKDRSLSLYRCGCNRVISDESTRVVILEFTQMIYTKWMCIRSIYTQQNVLFWTRESLLLIKEIGICGVLCHTDAVDITFYAERESSDINIGENKHGIRLCVRSVPCGMLRSAIRRLIFYIVFYADPCIGLHNDSAVYQSSTGPHIMIPSYAKNECGILSRTTRGQSGSRRNIIDI